MKYLKTYESFKIQTYAIKINSIDQVKNIITNLKSLGISFKVQDSSSDFLIKMKRYLKDYKDDLVIIIEIYNGVNGVVKNSFFNILSKSPNAQLLKDEDLTDGTLATLIEGEKMGLL